MVASATKRSAYSSSRYCLSKAVRVARWVRRRAHQRLPDERVDFGKSAHSECSRLGESARPCEPEPFERGAEGVRIGAARMPIRPARRGQGAANAFRTRDRVGRTAKTACRPGGFWAVKNTRPHASTARAFPPSPPGGSQRADPLPWVRSARQLRQSAHSAQLTQGPAAVERLSKARRQIAAPPDLPTDQKIRLTSRNRAPEGQALSLQNR